MKRQRKYADHAAKLRAYREKDRERHNRKRAEWREANLEKTRQIARASFLRNKHKYRLHSVVRDARKRCAVGSFNGADIGRLAKLQRHRCAVCRVSVRHGFHVDHIIPLARGGSNDPANLQLLCAPCNQSKGAKDPHDFMRSRGFLL